MLSALAFANPAGTWAFLAVAAVAALYLLRSRHRPQAATGLFLWGAPGSNRAGGRRLENISAGRAFWFDMLAAALLALAMAEPAWVSRDRTRVIVLDDALGMRARGNWREAARIAGGIAASARQAAVVLAGERPRTGRPAAPAGGRDFAAWLEDGYCPAEKKGDLGKALAFAKEAYGAGADIHVISNQEGAADLAGAGATVHVLAGRGGNLAFSRIWRRAAGDGEEGEALFLGVENFGGAAEAVLSVFAEGEEAAIAARRLALPPGRSNLDIPLAGRAGDTLRVELSGGEDCIALDSTAFVPPPGPGRPTAAVRGMDAAARGAIEAALRAAGCALLDDAGAAELLATSDRAAAGRVATLRFLEEDDPAAALPPFRIESANPLCRDVGLAGVVWALAARDHAARAEEVFIALGETPLFWREGESEFVFNLLPGRGNAALSPAWPILMVNLCERVEALRRGAAKRRFFPGEAASVRGGKAVLLRGGGVVAEAAGGALRMPGEAGLYRLAFAAGEGETAEETVAVLPLYGGASDARGLSGRAETLRGAEGAEGAEGRLDLRWALALCAAVLLGCNFMGKT